LCANTPTWPPPPFSPLSRSPCLLWQGRHYDEDTTAPIDDAGAAVLALNYADIPPEGGGTEGMYAPGYTTGDYGPPGAGGGAVDINAIKPDAKTFVV
jgi:hypothetical protein